MADDGRASWRLTAVAMAVVVVAALATGLFIASWAGEPDPRASGRPTVRAAALALARTPAQGDVEACNTYARAEAGEPGVDVAVRRPDESRYARIYRTCIMRRGFAG